MEENTCNRTLGSVASFHCVAAFCQWPVVLFRTAEEPWGKRRWGANIELVMAKKRKREKNDAAVERQRGSADMGSPSLQISFGSA
jgi:hypothetical protein